MSRKFTDEEFAKLLQPHVTAKEVCFMRLSALYELSKKVVENTDNAQLLGEFNARLQDLSSYRDRYETIVSDIYAAKRIENSKFVPDYSEITEFDRIFYEIRNVSDKVKIPASDNKCDISNNGSNVVPRLPKLEIFHFDGNLENWPTFRDTFRSLVHSNTKISDIEKFYYLLSSVSGSALTIVKTLPVTANNYIIVWNALVKRYENKRALATTYLDKIFSFKPLQNESVSGLNIFIQTFQENYKAIETLQIPDFCGFLLFYIAIRNLDSVTRREFEQTMTQSQIPSFKDLIEFIEGHVRVLEMSQTKPVSVKQTLSSNKPAHLKVNQSSGSKTVSNKSYVQKTTLAASAVTASGKQGESKKSKECLYCSKPHSIYRCVDFNDLTPEQRLVKITELKLCENCLRDNHQVDECTSRFRCTVCKQMHHHKLHVDTNAVKCDTSNNAVTLTCSTNSTVLLGTALVHVRDCWGDYQTVRCIIDSGAMTGYMTQDCAKRLGLSRRKCNFAPVGLGGKPVKEYGLATCHIKPRDQSAPVLISDVVVVTNIAGKLPTLQLPGSTFNAFQNLKLADPNFFRPASVDLLLAADLFPYIYDGQKVMPYQHGLVALNSIFGYVITGSTNNDTPGIIENDNSTNNLCAFSMNLEHTMQAFWDVENVPSAKMLHPDDILADQLFDKEHSRDGTGRYVVRYPLRPDVDLGESRPLAERRLANLESKLEREPQLKVEYHKFMREYEDLGHMTCVGKVQNVDSKYIIPHFCIFKPSSTSTKLRVVFDASCKTTNGESLNSVALPGPKLQADINKILINFRLREICLSADICKMYRQILIDKGQRPYQHILWRYDRDEPVQVFKLNTVTYGVASSPYLAIKVLHTLAEDEADRFPGAAAVLKQAFFMDDFLWSVDTAEEAAELQDELMALLQRGGFLLRKWSSNSLQVLARLPQEHRETPFEFDDNSNMAIKILGLQWLTATDTFSFKTTPISHTVTKRTVLSQIGRQFDPLGFVAPCIFYAKCFMQRLWSEKVDWDQALPERMKEEWQEHISELPLLSNFQHERHATVSGHTYCQLLGFCDASSLGYAAVIYIRTVNQSGDSKVSLLLSKSKVAPRRRTVTIPRLELLAAHLLAKCIKYVKSMVQGRLHLDETLLFTDSSVVLAWLNIPTYNLKTFIATRVSYILDTIPSECWHHVEGASNPADVCSRGALPSALLRMPEWLSGPTWIADDRSQWPVKTIDNFKYDNPPELKVTKAALVTADRTEINPIMNLTERYSSYIKLINVVARCFQFIYNCRSPRNSRRSILKLDELRKAHDIIIKLIQQHYFADDIEALEGEDKDKKCSHVLQKLKPFVDSNGFLRVGGRLSQSDLPYEKKHPLLLPKNCNFTRILIDYYHKLYLHVGPRTLQSIISQKYWIIAARSVIRSRTVKCIACFKVAPRKLQPSMGELPKFRSQDVHAFHTVGIDIGGPFSIKESSRRNAPVTKAYLCVYVCCATRAVHLEVLSSLSTECFLACFDRFTARRGLCHTIVSDNGTNFVAAGKQLAEVARFLRSNATDLSNGLTMRSVQWKHNPPTGSHFGGLYEAVVKSAKLHLKRTVGTRALLFEELSTLFARAEAVLNSRPLCALSNDPNEFDVLTPSHFLIGRECLSPPEYDLTDLTVVQQLSQLFWKRWRQDYLYTLNQRQKWFNECKNIKINDLVLINSDAPPLEWMLGRVITLHPGPDGVVRVVTVRTKNSELTRPVVKLSPLPLEQDTA